MIQIEEIVFPLVESHFPDFYRDEGIQFINFVKEYYRWMESEGQSIYGSRNLLNSKDIDTTSPDFIKFFKNKFLSGIPLSTESNTQFLIKHASDIHTSKGTERGVQLLIQGLFNQESRVVFPGENILKTSDGTWVRPTYLELSVSEKTKDFVGKEIIGSRSGAKAFLESLVTRRIAGKYLQVAYLSNVRGIFQNSEFVTPTVDTNLENAPIIIGSMTSLTVLNGGAEFSVGDIFEVSSPNGKLGKARVTEVSNETGTVSFQYENALISGGWGYSLDHTNVLVSKKVLTLNNIRNSNSLIGSFSQFESVSQPLINIGYTSAKGNNQFFEIGNVIENYFSNGDVAANATIVVSNKVSNTAGSIIVVPNIGNISSQDTTFAVRSENPDISSFNASFVGYAFNTFTKQYTNTYTSQFTGEFTSSYSQDFVGTFSSTFGNLFTNNFSLTFTSNFNSQSFTGSYTSLFTSSYDKNFTSLFTTIGTTKFSGEYIQYYTSQFTGIFSPVFSKGYSGTYTLDGFTGTYSKTYTGEYTNVYSKIFTGPVVLGNFSSSYKGSYQGNYGQIFTGTKLNPFNGLSYAENFAGYFSGVYIGSYTGSYPKNYQNPYNGLFFVSEVSGENYFTKSFVGVFNGLSFTGSRQGFLSSFSKIYTGEFTSNPVYTGIVGPFSGFYTAQGYTGSYIDSFSKTFTGTFTSGKNINFSSLFNAGVNYTREFTQIFSSSFSTLFTSEYTKSFTGAFSKSYTNIFTGVFTNSWSQSYTGLYNIYSSDFTPTYTSDFTLSFSNFSNLFTPTYTNSFTNKFSGVYSQAFVGIFSGQFTGLAYSVDYSGFSKSFSATFTGTFNPSFSSTYNSFTGVYTRNNFTQLFSGTYEGNFTRNFTPSFTGSFTTSYTKQYTGTYDSFSSLYTASFTPSFSGNFTGNVTKRINTLQPHNFSNNDIVRYHVKTGNTALVDLSTGSAYYVVNTIQGSTSLHLSDSYDGSAKSLSSGLNETGHDLVRSLGTGVISAYTDVTATGNVIGSNTTFLNIVFNAQTSVSSADYLITVNNHTFQNNYIVSYTVKAGNNAINGLVDGGVYKVVNTSLNSFQLSNSESSEPLNISSSNINENGHILTYKTGFLGVVDISNVFISSNSTKLIGLTSNTTASIANVSTGLNAGFEVGLLTDTENVFLSPDFINGNNTGNVVFNTVRLNGIGSNVISSGYGSSNTFNANNDVTEGPDGTGVLLPSSVQFNALTGVSNTNETITLSTSHVFSNGEQVKYLVTPGNTAVGGLASNTDYFVINTTPGSTYLQLSATSGGSPINITASVNETGHSLTRQGTTGSNSSIALQTAINYVPNSAIFYFVNTGNTAVDNLTNNTVYFIDQSNATHVTLKETKVGNRINLIKGNNETGHNLYGPLKILLGSNSVNGNTGKDLPMFGGLGFEKFPGTNLDTILLDALRFNSTTIGSIATIVSVNPGSEYNVDPFVTVVDTFVTGYNARDYVMSISNTVGSFIVGEEIQQSYANNGIQLTISNFSGVSPNGVSTSTFVLNEFVYQGSSPTDTTASGTVIEAAVSGGSGSLKIKNVTGSFVNTTNSLTQLKGLSSGSTSNVSAVSVVSIATTARALIKEIGFETSANLVANSLKLKRINLENTFLNGSPIVGRVSGSQADVVNVIEDSNTIVVGLNASILANVQTSNNVVKKLDVADSGFGFLDKEVVTLNKQGSVFSVTAIVELNKQGIGSGFHKTTQGFLSDDKKLQDNDFYQEYSYEVQTKIPFDKYFDILKQVTHVAGTKAFGRVSTISVANLEMKAINNIQTNI